MKFDESTDEADSSFELTPMIDVLFVLLCFFVVAQLHAQYETEMDLTLPTAESGQAPDHIPGEIVINIKSDGSFRFLQQTINADELSDKLHRLGQLTPGQRIIVRADENAPYRHFAKVMDLCRLADLSNVRMSVNPAPSK